MPCPVPKLLRTVSCMVVSRNEQFSTFSRFSGNKSYLKTNKWDFGTFEELLTFILVFAKLKGNAGR